MRGGGRPLSPSVPACSDAVGVRAIVCRRGSCKGRPRRIDSGEPGVSERSGDDVVECSLASSLPFSAGSSGNSESRRSSSGRKRRGGAGEPGSLPRPPAANIGMLVDLHQRRAESRSELSSTAATARVSVRPLSRIRSLSCSPARQQFAMLLPCLNQALWTRRLRAGAFERLAAFRCCARVALVLPRSRERNLPAPYGRNQRQQQYQTTAKSSSEHALLPSIDPSAQSGK